MHTATLFIDKGVASGRGWWINHSEDCVYSEETDQCSEPSGYEEVRTAVHAIYEAVQWPYPEGLWPVGVFTAAELRDHLSRFMASR